MKTLRYLSLLACLSAPWCAAAPAAYEFGPWAAGTSPTEIGNRVAERFLSAAPAQSPKPTRYVPYREVCTWYGALTFADVSKNKGLAEQLAKRFDPLLTPASWDLIPPLNHVDYCVFGAVPLELYMQTQRPQYRALGLQIADGQWDNPTPEGYTRQTRLWIDDMFMITAVQVQAYRATGDAKYLDRAAREMAYYLDQLQQPNGLFFHAPDAPFFWGRGNGWVAVGMAEVLRSLPETHPQHARILAGYRKMMGTLLQFQAADGMWRQLIDKPEAWPETSCTGMFAFAFVTGVRNGWLDAATYGPAAKKAWLKLITYLDANADLREVCGGTNKKNDLQFYLDRPRIVGDMHGQAPVLWTATALLR